MQDPKAKSGLQVILATEKDNALLARLEAACFAPPWSAQSCGHEIRYAQVFILYQDNIPVGYASLGSSGDQAELRRMAILPEHRGQRLGHRLLAEIVGMSRRQGFREILLEVAEGNLPALALYTSFGFIKYHRRKKYYSDGSDALLLKLPLPCEHS